jgi:hypothetical protein
MRGLIFWLGLGLGGALGAQAPLHIVAVERTGLPPYESEDRVYCMDGGQDRGLRVGDRLFVKRTGDVRVLGHLWVTEVRGDQARARYEPMETVYPMKGDLAILEVLKWMPETGRLNPDPLPVASPPGSTSKAPPREGVLFFLPQQAELSPAGVKKLETWVEEWGREGQWGIQVPMAKAIKPALQKQRIASLEAALHSLGLEHVKLETDPRTTEGKNDPAWIRHWD